MKIESIEQHIIELQYRFDIMHNLLGCGSEFRRIGRVMLHFEHPRGTTIRALERATGIPRRSLRRKIETMQRNGLVTQNRAGHFGYTRLGRELHIMTFRDMVRIASGDQIGLSQEVIGILSGMTDRRRINLEAMKVISFDSNLPINMAECP